MATRAKACSCLSPVIVSRCLTVARNALQLVAWSHCVLAVAVTMCLVWFTVHRGLHERITTTICCCITVCLLWCHCMQANSEVSALLGRIPSAVGYQPTLATDLGGLQERSMSGRGSVTI